MSIRQTDIVFKLAESNVDGAANGGRISNYTVPANMFPSITGAEAEAGLVRYRKVFLKNEQSSGTVAADRYVDLAYIGSKVFLDNFSTADDYYQLLEGTPTDTQADSSAYTGWASTGYLTADIAIGATSCTVAVEGGYGASECFWVGADVLLTTKDGAGTVVREFITLTSVSNVNEVYTLGFTGTPTANAYSRSATGAAIVPDIFTSTTLGKTTSTMTVNLYANRRLRVVNSVSGLIQVRRILSNTATTFTINSAWGTTPDANCTYEVLGSHACACLELGGIAASYSNVVKNGLVFDVNGLGDATDYLKVYPVGAIDDSWTILFSSATNFTIVGAYHTASTSGIISGTTRVANGASYCLEISPSAFTGGTYQNGNTITFDTASSSGAFWIRETVPALSLAHGSNTIDLGCYGDTV